MRCVAPRAARQQAAGPPCACRMRMCPAARCKSLGGRARNASGPVVNCCCSFSDPLVHAPIRCGPACGKNLAPCARPRPAGRATADTQFLYTSGTERVRAARAVVRTFFHKISQARAYLHTGSMAWAGPSGSRASAIFPRPDTSEFCLYYLYIYLRDRAGARGARGSTYIYSQDQSSTSVSTYRKALGLSRARAWTSTQPQHEGARDTITAPRLRRRKDAERQSLRTQLLPPNRPNAPPPLARRSRARAPRTQTARPRAADGTCRPMHRRRAAAAAQIAAAARRRVAGSAADPGEGRPLRLPSRARAHPHGRGQQSRKRCKRGISYSYIYSL